MLTKDQVFSIQEFIYSNSSYRLWEVGEKLSEVAPELQLDDSQKETVSHFLAKNGRKAVSDIDGAIYSLFNKLAAPQVEELVS